MDKKYTSYRNNKCLKPEDVCVHVDYSLTINPEYQPTHHITESFIDDSKKHLNYYLSRMKYSEIKLNTELSSTGRIHYHGYIRITNIKGFYIHDLHLLNLIGHYEIDTISQLDIWENYIHKQNHIFGTQFEAKRIELVKDILKYA